MVMLLGESPTPSYNEVVNFGNFYGYFWSNKGLGITALRAAEKIGPFAKEAGIVERPNVVTVYSLAYRIVDWTDKGFPVPSKIQVRNMQFLVEISDLENLKKDVKKEATLDEYVSVLANLRKSYLPSENPISDAKGMLKEAMQKFEMNSRY